MDLQHYLDILKMETTLKDAIIMCLSLAFLKIFVSDFPSLDYTIHIIETCTLLHLVMRTEIQVLKILYYVSHKIYQEFI